MKRLLACGLLLPLLAALATPASAQGQQAQLKAKLDAKKQEAWITKNGWITDYDKAKAEAKKSGKVIFAYFTRSYAP